MSTTRAHILVHCELFPVGGVSGLVRRARLGVGLFGGFEVGVVVVQSLQAVPSQMPAALSQSRHGPAR